MKVIVIGTINFGGNGTDYYILRSSGKQAFKNAADEPIDDKFKPFEIHVIEKGKKEEEFITLEGGKKLTTLNNVQDEDLIKHRLIIKQKSALNKERTLYTFDADDPDDDEDASPHAPGGTSSGEIEF